jgi:hypothetical protein
VSRHPGHETAVAVGSERPIDGLIHDHYGWTILFSDAPMLNTIDETNEHEWLTTICVGCLIDEYPETGRGLDLALETGYAYLDDAGQWQAGVLDSIDEPSPGVAPLDAGRGTRRPQWLAVCVRIQTVFRAAWKGCLR